MKQNWYNNKGVKVVAHVVAWAIVLSLPHLLNGHRDDPHPTESRVDRSFFYLNLFTNFFWVAPFYLNAYWLTPRLFNNRKYLGFVAILIALFGIIMVIHSWMFSIIIGSSHFSWLGATGYILPTFVLTIAIGTTFRVVRDKIAADQLGLSSELSFLRSQISPHFIFNILNNLVALERRKSAELGPTILKLSSLMQYMLYETDEDSVSLDAEVDYLRSYIDLQRQRFGEKVDIRVTLEAPEYPYSIEPMLLIPFVENAFKHGVGMIEQPLIDIHLRTKDKELNFSVRNRYNPAYEEVRDKTSGIGLANVKRRLKLLYEGQHHLEIARDQEWFSVSLTINLH